MLDDTTMNTSEDLPESYAERVQEAITPVAVAVVAAEPLRIQRHPSSEFTTGSVSVQPALSPVQIIGSNPWRDRLMVQNKGTSTVYVGSKADTLTPTGGYPVEPGHELELFTRRAVYVVAASDATLPANVHFLAEHVDG